MSLGFMCTLIPGYAGIFFVCSFYVHCIDEHARAKAGLPDNSKIAAWFLVSDSTI
jgi:hypothetical protein